MDDMNEIIVSSASPVARVERNEVDGNSRDKLKKEIIKKHHGGNDSLWSKIKAEGFVSNEKFIQKLMEEQLGETDSLSAYGEILYQDGEVRDAAAISVKRIEAIQSVIKTVQVKQQMEKETGTGVDVYSPAMAIVFRYFLNKVKLVLEDMGADASFSASFFQKFVSETQNWPTELQMELEKFQVIAPDDNDFPIEQSQKISEED